MRSQSFTHPSPSIRLPGKPRAVTELMETIWSNPTGVKTETHRGKRLKGFTVKSGKEPSLKVRFLPSRLPRKRGKGTRTTWGRQNCARQVPLQGRTCYLAAGSVRSCQPPAVSPFTVDLSCWKVLVWDSLQGIPRQCGSKAAAFLPVQMRKQVCSHLYKGHGMPRFRLWCVIQTQAAPKG